MNILQNISFSIINLTPPWFFNLLNFSSWFWVQLFGGLSILFIIRTIYVFFSTKSKFAKINKTSNEQLANLVKEKKVLYPKFSVLVPARNESDVVEKTIKKLIQLDYPNDRFEIIIITDEKETLNNQSRKTTTQEVVQKIIKELESQPVKIYHLDVPYNFNGLFKGKLMDHEIKSTKGRALNYAFTAMFDHFNFNTDFFAFFDTDDHPDKTCLIEIAKEYLNHPHKKVFQLPIFQCRNFWQISTFSKVIALGQSFSHEIFLPWVLTWLPFLGGTNLFIQKDVLFQVDGFNYNSITEDLDLGVTIYLKTGNWPYYLPFASTEQTPDNVKAYLKQRHRWALGLLEVIQNLKKQKNWKTPLGKKSMLLYLKLILYGPAEWVIYFAVTVLSMFILFTRLLRTIVLVIGMQQVIDFFSFSLLAKELLISVLTFAGMPMIVFSLFLLLHYNRYIEYQENNWVMTKKFLKFLIETSLVLPFMVVLYPWPFFSAFFKYTIGYYRNRELTWVKTPRTKE